MDRKKNSNEGKEWGKTYFRVQISATLRDREALHIGNWTKHKNILHGW